jgi:hypothetical protein
VSVEPYPTPNLIKQNLSEILESIAFTDKIIFGRTNYSKEISAYATHRDFYNEQAALVIDFCKKRNILFHIKEKTISNPKPAKGVTSLFLASNHTRHLHLATSPFSAHS